MELWLVRHGEDRAAVERRFADEGLSERGREQARELARRLRGTVFDRCLCSPLQRARETADELLAGRELEARIEPSLAEGSAGALLGLDHATARARFPEDFRLGSSVGARLAATGRTAPDGESLVAFLDRARLALALFEQQRADTEKLLVVSHGGILNYLLQLMFDVQAYQRVPFGFDHCGVLRVLDYREEPGFGPFPMLRFGIPG